MEGPREGSGTCANLFTDLVDSTALRARLGDCEKPIAFPLPSASRRVIYLPWLKVCVALRYLLTFPWAPEAWREVGQHIPWLLAEQSHVRKAGSFN